MVVDGEERGREIKEEREIEEEERGTHGQLSDTLAAMLVATVAKLPLKPPHGVKCICFAT